MSVTVDCYCWAYCVESFDVCSLGSSGDVFRVIFFKGAPGSLTKLLGEVSIVERGDGRPDEVR